MERLLFESVNKRFSFCRGEPKMVEKIYEMSSTGMITPRYTQNMGIDLISKLITDHKNFLSGTPGGKRLILSYRRLTNISFVRSDLRNADFTGATLVDCDFAFSNFEGSIFYCANLSGSSLVAANLTKCDLRGAKLNRVDLTHAILDWADCREGTLLLQNKSGNLVNIFDLNPDLQFDGTDDRPATFNNSKAHETSLSNANMASASFKGAIITKARFDNANLTRATFKGTVIKETEFTNANLENADFSSADLVNTCISGIEFLNAKMVKDLCDFEEDLQRMINDHKLWVDTLSTQGKRIVIKNRNLCGLQMPNVDWSAADFTNVNFKDAVLSGSKFMMATFKNCRFDGADFSGANFGGTTVTNSSFTCANFEGSAIQPVKSLTNPDEAWGPKLSLCNFTEANFNGSKIGNCSFTGSTFHMAILTKCEIVSCDFSEANLCYADFRGSNIKSPLLTRARLHAVKGLPL